MKVARLRDSIDHVTPLALGNGTRLVQPGTILMVVRGMSLVHSFPVAILERPVTFNQDLKAFVPHSIVSGEFVLRWLEANQPRILLLATEATHGTKRIPTRDLQGSYIALPPPAEQHAVAEALLDVERLLGALGALIAKKLATKQGAMQQLLTGKTRLPGFSGEWKTKRLGEIGRFSKGRGVKREDICDDGLPCIRYGELYTRYQNYLTRPVSHIPLAVARTALPIKTGDLLFAGSGETAEEIGRCAAYLGDEQAFAGGDIIVLTPSGQNSMYLGHLMNHSLVATQKARFAQGHTVVHISARNLSEVEVKLPPVDEQAGIATVLSDIDAEIVVLERRRDKTRAIKQGMMQQLLTGRVRLVSLPRAGADT